MMLVSMRFSLRSQHQLASENYDSAPQYVLRDHDGVYGAAFRRRIESMGIEDVPTPPRSLWRSPYVERAIGPFRRDCLSHVIVVNDGHLHWFERLAA